MPEGPRHDLDVEIVVLPCIGARHGGMSIAGPSGCSSRLPWSTSTVLLAVAAISALWVLTTAMFWAGYAGADDLFYARYAYLFHRPPINWWEFRLPAILAIRASFLTFGPSEFAAALPSLLSSLLILVSIAWQVDWLKRGSWETTLALVVACTLPLDVRARSVPLAGFISAGLVVLGSVCMLRRKPRVPFVGSILLAGGFITHEVSFFYVAILCLSALVADWQRFWRPVIACIATAGALVVIEGAAYFVVLGDFFSRWKVAAGTTQNLTIGVDPDTGIEGIRFFLWPVEGLFFSSAFGVDLILLAIAGTVAWRRLEPEQRILLCSSLGLYVWLGYGTQVPWAYKPFYRQFQYYFPVVLGVACVLPFALRHACQRRAWLAWGMAGFAILVHVAFLVAGGRWGQDVDVSKQLLQYAKDHPSQRFLTDVVTMNHMYVLAGFQVPHNVVCLDGPAVERHLLLNKEPRGVPRWAFSGGDIDGILVNLEGVHNRVPEEEFLSFLTAHQREHLRVAPLRYRFIFLPVLAFLEPREFMVRSLGGEVVYVGDETNKIPTQEAGSKSYRGF